MSKSGKKAEWQKVRYVFVRPVVIAVSRWFFHAYARVNWHIKGPYLVLGNHTHPVDAMMMSGAFLEPLHIVAASAIFGGTLGKMLQFMAKPILVDKASIDMAAIRRMLNEAKMGHSIGLYPEGNITIDGSTIPFDPAIAKLAKHLKMKIVLFRAEGGYFKLPKWARFGRKGRIQANVVDVISPEEVAAMSLDELYRRIVAGISFDPFAAQETKPVAYPSPRAAEGIERLLYYCPKCACRADFQAKGHTFTCSHCGEQYSLDDYGHLSGPFANTMLWNRWQMQLVEKEPDPAVFAVQGKLYEGLYPCAVNRGMLTLTPHALTIGARSFPYHSVNGVVLHACNQILLTVGAVEYRFIPDDDSANVLPLLSVLEKRIAR